MHNVPGVEIDECWAEPRRKGDYSERKSTSEPVRMYRSMDRHDLLRLGCSEGVGWEREANVWSTTSSSVLQEAVDKHLISESIFLGLTLFLICFCILASVLNWSRVAGTQPGLGTQIACMANAVSILPQPHWASTAVHLDQLAASACVCLRAS